MKHLHNEEFRGVKEGAESARQDWENVHNSLGVDSGNTFWLQVDILIVKQSSRVMWLKEGDNSSYFHVMLKARNSGNSIDKLILEDGETRSSKEDI